MITDHLANAHRYADLGGRLLRAFQFLQHTNLVTLPEGRYDLEGADVYALVQCYTSKLEGQGRWEAHQVYTDLQYVVEGEERMGYGPIARFERGQYDRDKDIEFLAGAGEFLRLGAGGFIVLWPGEVHMPGMAAGDPSPVKKVVVKLKTG